MAKLTKKQVSAIEMIAIYYSMAVMELDTNGVTEKYDEHVWMYVFHRDQLGLEVSAYQRATADRYWAATKAAA
jgi:hypothetical protein